ncbi:tetratricopeptide repeat protein [Mucilaginibacter sp. PAMB04168]|uniref:tetratricopeptide repeat protein n=1 Tax=Mucilaginibacter sp. PAMB04168 TaxID=3138567 RepID=UPI0031F6A769
MKKIFTFLVLILVSSLASATLINRAQDTTEVVNLYIRGYEMRMTDARQTIKYADRALSIAKKLNYSKGVANAYRVRGIGEYYIGHSEKAIENYLSSLAAFQKSNDALGEARIYLNISSLYLDVDYDKCLEYLNAAVNLYHTKHIDNKNILASIYLNFGNVYQLQTNYSKALVSYTKSYDIIRQINNPALSITVMQNLGVIYSATANYSKAKEYLFKAIEQAKILDLNQPVAQINLTLAEIYIAEGDFKKAEECLTEGKAYSALSKNEKIDHSYQITSYLLELKRKNFEKALNYLQSIYRQDSIDYKSRNSAALSLYQANYRQEELKRKNEQMMLKNEQIMLKQEYARNTMIGTVILAAFLTLVIVLLVSNVKRKAETNKKLTELNTEISNQKDNLDRINHHLEEIIDERTKDLQLKNRKLSDYSSHLSHQIRGPIATLKGLMNLEREGLVSQEECIQMMIKCVSEIDDKIIDMSDMLHNPQRAGM